METTNKPQRESNKEQNNSEYSFEEFEVRETGERFRYFADGKVEKIED